ncbi:MAG: hypothetical protein LPK47_10935 [Bacteroidota bacterium]|nr:hypothetical protein [Bacteroidota bacterium]
MQRNILLGLFAMLLVLSGCSKDEFTRPTTLELQFHQDYGYAINGSLHFDEIKMRPSRVEIDGLRSVAEDIYLKTDYNPSVTWLCSQEPVESYEVPQGDYDRIEFTYTWRQDIDLEEDQTKLIDRWYQDKYNGEDPDDLLDDMGDIVEEYIETNDDNEDQPAFMLLGEYYSGGKTYLVVFVINDPWSLRAVSRNTSNTSSVVLQEGMTNLGTFDMDPSDWFTQIGASVMDNADKGLMDNGQFVILLHKKVNSQIFTSVLNRLNQSAVIEFK